MATSGKLYLIPTVIADGSSQDVLPTAVAKAILDSHVFLVENIRTARRCISAMNLGIDISTLHFQLLDKKTDAGKLSELMQPLQAGKNIGLMSEAGCPAVADPGALAVEKAHQMNAKVIPLVGPSSILLALMASGFSGQQFAFHAYLPIDKSERQKKIQELERESMQKGQTQLFMDTPYRNEQLFNDLIKYLHPNTKLCLALDLTGEKEWVRTESVKKWPSCVRPNLHKIPMMFCLAAY